MAGEAKLIYNFVRNKLHYGELEGLQSTLYKIPPSLREFQDCGIKTWYFKGQTSDKICKYESSRSSNSNASTLDTTFILK